MNVKRNDNADQPEEDARIYAPKSFLRLTERHSPGYLLAVIVGSIVAVDLFVLTALHAVSGFSTTAEVLIGTLVTALVLTPLLYLLAFYPLANEIRARRRMEEELKKLATTDNLTKLSNRAKFYEVIDREVERFKRHGQPLSMLLFDIDDFKTINDTHGHNVGDEALKSLTRLVAAQLREIDYFVRWGGDEFIIVAPDTGIDKAAALAERARKVVEAHTFQTAGRFTLTFSVTQFKAGDTVDSFLKRADRGLYRAKEAGKNRVEECR